MGFFTRIKSAFSKKKPELKMGLALGSGGAKGMTHLGVLKAFEEEGIRFSYVTGTSIGSIVGALYAKGYSSNDMIGIVESLNRKEFSKNLRPFSDMAFAEQFLEQYVEGNISDLPLPYAAWGTDAETNEGVLLNEGKTAKICSASSAIPPFFKSVEIEGKKIYDGAFTNAIPADVCKDLGAQFVVAVDLSAYPRSDEDKSMVSRLLGSALNAFVPVKYLDDNKTRGYDAADVMLRPNLYNYRATDVAPAAMNEMFEIGYEEAKSRMAELKKAIEDAKSKLR
ncbi:MAG: hypothetical protein HFE26_01505 [Clostridia bacterium]|nr:hypothetical protein [Clostridia bacterium]